MYNDIFITNDIIVDDTDSDTSSVSSINNMFDTSTKIDLINNLIKPINSYFFFDSEIAQEINDGFELSILRLLHIFFSIDGVINFPLLKQKMDVTNINSVELENFFLDIPGVMYDSDFYLSNCGIKIRKLWYKFLSNRDFFTYINNNHQLEPTSNNFILFFQTFFPLINTNKIEYIYDAFSNINYKFTSNNYNGLNHDIYINNIKIFIFKSTRMKTIIEYC